MPTEVPEVLRLRDYDPASLTAFLGRVGIQLIHHPLDEPIPGSYWGDEEAGLIGNRLYARDDTPLHSILHEASHYICVAPQRRAALDRDAGSDDAEENAVCYLQILLADAIESFGRERMLADMDRWGYSFRLGSSRAWFENDADDALAWLQGHGLVDCNRSPNYRLRISN